MLILGFVIHFWATPKEGLTANEKAAQNVARMEAKAIGSSTNTKSASKKDDSKYLKQFKENQEKQIQYLTIIAMLFGFGFLGYSFIKKEEVKS